MVECREIKSLWLKLMCTGFIIYKQSIVNAEFVCPSKPLLAHYADPVDCNGYIFCVRGTPYHRICPPDLYYNERRKRCDDKANVDCKVSELPNPRSKRISAPTSIENVNTKPNCTCTDNKPGVINEPEVPLHSSTYSPNPPVAPGIPLTMPNEVPGLHFPVMTPTNPENTESKPKVTTTPLPGKLTYQLSCKNQPCGIYPNFNDCSSFFHCSKEVKILKHCNDGQLFDTITLECQPPNKAKCWEEPVAEPLVRTPALTNLCKFHNKSIPLNSLSTDEIILSSPSITNWGTWKNYKFCPPNSYVNGIYVWRELVQRGSVIDQAGVASMSLNCANVNGDKIGNIISIAPNAPEEGWPSSYLCSGTGIGVRLNIQRDQGSGDDLATDNVELTCSCGPSVHKPYEEQTGLQSGNRGDWTKENICHPKQAICGMQPQMHTFVRDGSHDNTALNNLNMKCCNVPSPLKSCQPTETMKLIRKCSNVAGILHRRCDFESSIGLSYDESVNLNTINFYQGIGYDLNDIKPRIMNMFKEKFGKVGQLNSEMIYDWEKSPEMIWEKANTTVKFVYLDVNTTSDLYQIVGKCSIYEIRTNIVVKIDKMASGILETTYYYEI